MSTEVSFALSDKGPASYDALLARLSQSRFRSRFHLEAADIELIGRKSLPVVREHAVRFLLERLAPANPVNDGRRRGADIRFFGLSMPVPAAVEGVSSSGSRFRRIARCPPRRLNVWRIF